MKDQSIHTGEDGYDEQVSGDTLLMWIEERRVQFVTAERSDRYVYINSVGDKKPLPFGCKKFDLAELSEDQQKQFYDHYVAGELILDADGLVTNPFFFPADAPPPKNDLLPTRG